MQGGEDSQAAPAADKASESVSPIHRLSFAISMDISTLSGASSNVEITPMGEALTQTTLAHAQLPRSNIIATKGEEIGQDEVLREESDATEASDSSRANSTEHITAAAVSPQLDTALTSSAETLNATPEWAQGMTTADSASTQRSLHTGSRESASQQSQQQQQQHQQQSLDGTHLDMHAHMAATPIPSEEEVARAVLQEFTNEIQEDSLKLKKADALAASTGLPQQLDPIHCMHGDLHMLDALFLKSVLSCISLSMRKRCTL